MKSILILIAPFAFMSSSAFAQTERDKLHAEIATMDSTLFDAVNSRDIDKLKTMFSPDLEFYHDLGGLTNYEQNLEASRKNFASGRRIKRELVAGSMKVYPVPKHGAIQTGEHRFCDLAKATDNCSVYKFVHIWKQTSEGWKLSRVVSFDH